MKKLILLLISVWWLNACSEKEETKVTAIALNESTIELNIGDTYTFKVSHVPAEAKTPTYDWNSDNHGAVSMKGGGVIEALKDGTVHIVVTATDAFDEQGAPLKATCKVVIKPVGAEKVVISKDSLQLKVRTQANISCTIFPANTTHPEVVWQSGDESILTVTQSPYNPAAASIDALKAGKATVTVSLKNQPDVKAVCHVQVVSADLTDFALSETSKELAQGESFTLSPLFTPEDVENKNVKWRSSNESVATVSQGKVTALQVGECDIIALTENKGLQATCHIKVKLVALTGIAFEKNGYEIGVGEETALKIVFTPENASNKKVSWSSSDPTIVAVDKQGKIKGLTTGKATITAQSEDGNQTATCDVKVLGPEKDMEVSVFGQSIVSINGFITGGVGSSIKNNSEVAVKLTSLKVIDSSTGFVAGITTDEKLLGTLEPGETIRLIANLNSVYMPIFIWTFEYEGASYEVYGQYSYSLPFKGKAKYIH